MNRSLDLWFLGRVSGRDKGQRCAVLTSSGECGIARAHHALWIQEMLEKCVWDKMSRTEES